MAHIGKKHEAEEAPMPPLPPDKPAAPAGDELPPMPVADPGGPVPRVISQNERAPKGLKRFKLRCDNYQTQPTLYVLAKDEDQARAEYLKVTGIAEIVANAKKSGIATAVPHLAVKELAD